MDRFLYRILLAATAVCLIFVRTAQCVPTTNDVRPNIIFILADDLGYGDLGCYGQQTIKTPRIDRLAAEGCRFTDFYAGSTVCAPSRSVLMTGLHTGHTRVRGNSPLLPLAPDDVTLAEVLKHAGYATGIVGKWGLGEPGTSGVPTKQGFDRWFGYLNQRNAHNYYPEFLWRNERKIVLEQNQHGRKGAYSHDLFEQEALKFIEQHRREPFFLYLAFTLPHANNELTRKTGNGMEVPDYGQYATRDWPDPQKGHAAMISRLDRTVGRVIDCLETHGIARRTIVFFTSDNGPHAEGGAKPEFFNSNGPLRGIKRDLYEGGIRVPLIVYWPKHIAKGTACNEPSAFWDILPTAAELAGVAPPRPIDGVSLTPSLLGAQQAGHTQRHHDYLYWEFHERGFQQAVRQGRWKGIRLKQGGPLELYDLETDLSEQHNLAAEHPDIVARLESILAQARTPSPHWPPRTKSKKHRARAEQHR